VRTQRTHGRGAGWSDGLRDVLDLLESIISEAGDLIEHRSPELVAHARATLRMYGDATPRQAE
jgi:hypothetical protein